MRSHLEDEGRRGGGGDGGPGGPGAGGQVHPGDGGHHESQELGARAARIRSQPAIKTEKSDLCSTSIFMYACPARADHSNYEF